MTNYVEIPSNWGGAREGAGRNPVPDKKLQVSIMVPGSYFDKLGGKKGLQEIMLEAIEKALAGLDQS